MENAFSKVVAILLTVAMLFGVPYVYERQRNENILQYYLTAKSVEFVDGIRHTGFVSEEGLDAFYYLLSRTDRLYAVDLVHEKRVVDENTLTSVWEAYGEKDMREIFASGEVYDFATGDRILLTMTGQNGETLVSYGGTILAERERKGSDA